MKRGSMRRSHRYGRRREDFTGTRVAVVCLLLALLVSGFILFGAFQANAASSGVRCKYYTSIRVEQGDTLWSIADSYMTNDYNDIRDYIEEVCAINHITDKTIHSGQYLTVPYYSN